MILNCTGSPPCVFPSFKPDKVWRVTVDTVNEAKLIQKFSCSNIMHVEGKSVVRLLSEQGPCAEATPQSPNMEDVYLYYFGQ